MFVFLLGFLLVIPGEIISSNHDCGTLHLNFGKITAPSEKEGQIVLYFPLYGNSVESLEIWGDEDFCCQGQKSTIPISRMKFEINNQIREISSDIAKMNLNKAKNKIENQQLALPFLIKIHPGDLPGIYETTLHIREVHNGNNASGHTFDVKVTLEVGSWINLSYEPDILKVDLADFEMKNVKNSKPLIIKIASNTKWKLYGKLYDANLEGLTNFKIDPSFGNDYIVINPCGVSLSSELVHLADGFSTGGIELDIKSSLKIIDFTKLKSGGFDFNIYFNAIEDFDY